MNNILLIIEFILSFASFIYLHKKYKKEGLYIWLIIAIIILNIILPKTITISNFDINIGIILETTIFIIANSLIQKYGQEETNTIIKTLLITSLFSYLIMCMVTLTNPSTLTMVMDKAYNKLFLNNLIIYFVNTISLLISIKVNSYIYYQLKTIENKIWVSNTLSMIISQLIKGILFGLMYLTYKNTLIDIIVITVIRYILAIITLAIGTIFIYYVNIKES